MRVKDIWKKLRLFSFRKDIIYGLVIWIFYLIFQSISIYGGDAGDLVSASYTFGIPHPPGYPLYTFLSGIVGHLVSYNTIAWRVSLISSFFAACSIILLFNILKILLRNTLIAFVGSLLLAFVYPFWLYAEVPEIFSLSTFFVLFLMYLLMRYKETYNFRYLLAVCFIFGLSLTHHHMVLFFVPAIFVICWSARISIFKNLNKKRLLLLGVAFLLGLIPLLYLPIAASFYPPIDWEHPNTLSKFLGLLFRSSYGTFKAGPFTVDAPLARVYSIIRFNQFFLSDFKWIGVGFLFIGIIEIYRKTKYFWFILVALVSYLFFLAYASFPLLNEFSLATYERFIIFPYLFLILFISMGIKTVWGIFTHLRFFPQDGIKQRVIRISAAFLFLIYPFGNFMHNLPLIQSLKSDTTAENVAADILKTAPPDSLILLINDTAIFNTQYVYYTSSEYKNINFLPMHLYKLFNSSYHESLKRLHPTIYLPEMGNLTEEEFVLRFIEGNSDKFIVMTNFTDQIIRKNLVPNGLLFRYYKDDLPSLNEVVDVNKNIWKAYQALNSQDIKYRNLFLVDILRMYSNGHQNYANYLIDNNLFNDALLHLAEAKKLTPDDKDILFLSGKLQEKMGECELSEEQYLLYKEAASDDAIILEHLVRLSRDCFKDTIKESSYKKELEMVLKSFSPKAQDL